MNIELFTLSELIEVRGEEGDFSVKVRKKPRYVDMNKCIACGLCAEKCPKKVSDEYNMGMGKRKSIFIRYGQTVPLKYAIDSSSCLLMTRENAAPVRSSARRGRSTSTTGKRW